MIPREIIEKAIEGGWWAGNKAKMSHANANWQIIALDSTFWQALGKALGWSEAECLGMEADLTCPCKPRTEVVNGNMITIHNGSPRWRTEAHNFYGYVLRGEDTTEFWNDLLGKEN